MNDKEKNYLLKLARRAIKEYLTTSKKITLLPTELSAPLQIKQGVFVTLTKDSELRGCIGSLVGQEPIYQGVIDNAINATVNDPRFSPVTADELEKIKIEISVLTPPVLTSLDNIVAGQDGVILQQGNQGATYLPQVWEHFNNNREEFFSSLCQKAGLSVDCWRDPQTKFEKYQVEKFEEG